MSRERVMPPAPVLVLVAVQDLVNLASCVRIAKNFGISEIRLVAPECPVDLYRIEGVAHNTADVLERMTIHATIDEAFADLSYVLALTGRERTAKRAVLRPREAAVELAERSLEGRVGILAGREDHGLSNEELDRCAKLVTISANPEYTSLNLAQAWAVMAYETWVARGGDQIPLKRPRHAAGPTNHAELEALFADWEASMHAIEFFKKRQSDLVMRGFREVIFRADLDVREAGLFRAIGLEIGHFLRRKGLLPQLPRKVGGQLVPPEVAPEAGPEVP
ncbi:MAG: TrmH family RNA methyltransferase [Gemmatimonadales bacterium]